MMREDVIIQHYFNGLATEWEKNEPEEKQKIIKILSRLNIKENYKILDLGCGTGILFPLLTMLTKGRAKIFAIDFAQRMVQQAEENKNQPIDIMCGDVQHLPFRDNVFHRIVAFHVFPHIRHKNFALKECRRVLKPSGELGIIHLYSSQEINSIHAIIGGIVKDHKLPSKNQMCHLLQEEKFVVKTAIDKPGQYFIRAIK